jgi:hypothetical protein
MDDKKIDSFDFITKLVKSRKEVKENGKDEKRSN